MTTGGRIWVGRDAEIVRERADGLELESLARLRPGHGVELVLQKPNGSGPAVRRAVVWSWTLVSVGSDGPIYRGVCLWS